MLHTVDMLVGPAERPTCAACGSVLFHLMVNVFYTTERSFNSRSHHEIFRYETSESNEEKTAVTQRMCGVKLKLHCEVMMNDVNIIC